MMSLGFKGCSGRFRVSGFSQRFTRSLETMFLLFSPREWKRCTGSWYSHALLWLFLFLLFPMDIICVTIKLYVPPQSVMCDYDLIPWHVLSEYKIVSSPGHFSCDNDLVCSSWMWIIYFEPWSTTSPRHIQSTRPWPAYYDIMHCTA